MQMQESKIGRLKNFGCYPTEREAGSAKQGHTNTHSREIRIAGTLHTIRDIGGISVILDTAIRHTAMQKCRVRDSNEIGDTERSGDTGKRRDKPDWNRE